MEGKYPTRKHYWTAVLKRAVLRAALRPLLSWRPMRNEKPGYTVIVACHAPLAEMALPSLELLSRQKSRNLACAIVSFDSPADARLRSLADEIRTKYPNLRAQFLYQTALQSKLLRKIGWGWVDCWLSYAKGVAACETRYAMLHDMDAMLLDPDLVERRFALLLERGDQFLGDRWYVGNGTVAEDRVCYIVEMMFDAEYVRRTFRPLDLFNVVARCGERTVDWDTFLYPQTIAARRSVESIRLEEMIHPSQVVSQYTLMARPGYVPPEQNNALFIPYFYYLTGREEMLRTVRAALDLEDVTRVPLGDRTMDLRRLSPTHAQWLLKQARRIEQAWAGSMREEVADYFKAVLRVAERNGASGAVAAVAAG